MVTAVAVVLVAIAIYSLTRPSKSTFLVPGYEDLYTDWGYRGNPYALSECAGATP
ncbi:MAG: hypothetical protein KGL39_01450 [Patescibacteria group bacterium]|nr:hypothetical protein [Patescibacteria group bacterium]